MVSAGDVGKQSEVSASGERPCCAPAPVRTKASSSRDIMSQIGAAAAAGTSSSNLAATNRVASAGLSLSVHLQRDGVEPDIASTRYGRVVIGNIGKVFSFFFHKIWLIVCFPWNLIWPIFHKRPYFRTETNAPYAITRFWLRASLWSILPTVDLLVLSYFLITHFKQVQVGAIIASWGLSFGSLQLLNDIIKLYPQLLGVPDSANWERAQGRYVAMLLGAFGVTATSMTRGKGRSDTIWPFLLVSFLPAVVVAYFVQWFFTDKGASLTAKWVCNEFVESCVVFTENRLNPFTFVAYLSGNTLAAYAGINFISNCCITYNESKGDVNLNSKDSEQDEELVNQKAQIEFLNEALRVFAKDLAAVESKVDEKKRQSVNLNRHSLNVSSPVV